MIKNLILTVVMLILCEGSLAAAYVIKSSLFEGAIQKFFQVFNFTEHFSTFTSGILDINGIVYFLSVAVICLFLASQMIQKRRWN